MVRKSASDITHWAYKRINEEKKGTRTKMVGGNKGKPPQTIWELFLQRFQLWEGNNGVKERADSGRDFSSCARYRIRTSRSQWDFNCLWQVKRIDVSPWLNRLSRADRVPDLPAAGTRCSVLSSWPRSQRSWRSRSWRLSRSVLQRTDRNVDTTLEEATVHHRRQQKVRYQRIHCSGLRTWSTCPQWCECTAPGPEPSHEAPRSLWGRPPTSQSLKWHKIHLKY